MCGVWIHLHNDTKCAAPGQPRDLVDHSTTASNNNNNIMVETHSSKKRKCNAGAAGADGVVWIVEQLQAAVSTSSEDIMSVKTSEA